MAVRHLLTMNAVLCARSDKVKLPEYQTSAAAGMDLQADIEEDYHLLPGERHLFPCGFKLAIPAGYEGQVRPRSGLAVKHGVTVLNSPGTVDADYRGEVGVILINHGNESFTVEPGMRIAQMVFAEHQRALLKAVEYLDATDRGEGGFGSTGAAHTNTAA